MFERMMMHNRSGLKNKPSNIILPEVAWSTLEEVTNLTSLPFVGQSIDVDENRVYLISSAGPGLGRNGLTVLNKSDFTVISNTPYIDTFPVKVKVDGDFIYIGMNTSPSKIRIYNKHNWTLLQEITIAAQIYEIKFDNNYIYVAHANGKRLSIIDKNTYLILQNTPTLPGTAWALDINENKVIVSYDPGSNGTLLPRVALLYKNDLTKLEKTINLQRTPYAIRIHNDELFIGNRNNGNVLVYDSNLNYSRFFNSPLSRIDILEVDDNYIYVVMTHLANESNYFNIIDKNTNQIVANQIVVPYGTYDIYVDREFIILTFDGNQPYYRIYKKII